MNATFKARIVQKMDVREGTSQKDGSKWRSQDVLVETVEEQYPKRVLLNFFNRDTERLREGVQYYFDYEVSAHEYNGRWYNQVRCFAYHAGDNPMGDEKDADKAVAEVFEPEQEKDDLPF